MTDTAQAGTTMSRKSTPHRQAAGTYSSDEIAAMPLEQLRELSDLQLSERELADVIAAIHGGGAQSMDDKLNCIDYNDAEAYQCPLCQQDGQVVSARCLACKDGSSTRDVQQQAHLLDQWVNWYKQYKVWAASCQHNEDYTKTQLS